MPGLWFTPSGGSQDWFTPMVCSALSPLEKSVKNEWKLHIILGCTFGFSCPLAQGDALSLGCFLCLDLQEFLC